MTSSCSSDVTDAVVADCENDIASACIPDNSAANFNLASKTAAVDITGHAPMMGIVASLSDHGVESLLAMHQTWLNDASMLSPAHGQWLYALLAALDRLLDADTTGTANHTFLLNRYTNPSYTRYFLCYF